MRFRPLDDLGDSERLNDGRLRGPRPAATSEAFLFERSIDIGTYDRHAEKLREELTLARIDRHSGQLEELDVEGILAFAERVLPRAADLWGAGLTRTATAVPTTVLSGRNCVDGNSFSEPA
jgi:hypothetical protein